MEKWAQVALVAAGGANFVLLCYVIWKVRNANRREMELKLTQIKQSVEKISADIDTLKLELTHEQHVRRRVRTRNQVVSDRDSEFQSTYESRNGESDNFFDFSDEEPNSKPNRKSLEEILLEIDDKDLECQSNSHTCGEVIKVLVELCPRHNPPLDTSSLTSAEVAWRLARCYIHSVAHMKESGINVVQITDTVKLGISYSEAAIRLDNDSWISHKWYAICCGTLSQSESTQEKARLGAEYKNHLEIAIKLAPNEPTLYHLMGNWYFELSHLSWVMKKAATTLYGNIFSGTVEQAEEMFLQAENLKPGFWIRNQVFLAKCCLKRGDKSGAEEWTRKALGTNVSTPDDNEAKTEAMKIANENSWEILHFIQN
ncbi:Regulator of microtubule dynamics protein 2 [Oopsacas minuta]|uniref:Regulator of microtubule dynamics protein 1 n=1 Tax=Oopsacas minuta TaxID=111878 RepID=A0AAV7JWI0_9METZ|nr:Regulator of microtubule dynamics protein 2 [Oopsacas minuta]